MISNYYIKVKNENLYLANELTFVNNINDTNIITYDFKKHIFIHLFSLKIYAEEIKNKYNISVKDDLIIIDEDFNEYPIK